MTLHVCCGPIGKQISETFLTRIWIFLTLPSTFSGTKTLLKTFCCHEWVEHLYSKHVMEKLDSLGEHRVLDIHNHFTSKKYFFKCFAPTGHMNSFALYAQCMLWNHQWKADNKPYIILSERNVVSTLFCKMQVHFFVFTNPFVLLI